MSSIESHEIAMLLQRIQSWPAPMRITLARRILQTLEEPSEQLSAPVFPRGPSAAEVAAMFKTDKPVPDDAECERILEEELTKKYGR